MTPSSSGLNSAQDRVSENDPTVTPASCKQAPSSALPRPTAARAGQILEADTPAIEARSFTHAFQIGLMYVIGLALAVTAMMFALPRKAKPQEV
jgi:hypothetical protein